MESNWQFWKPFIYKMAHWTYQDIANCTPRRLLMFNMVIDWKNQLEKENSEKLKNNGT